MKLNIKELTRLDFLIDLKNQMLKELVLNQMNVASITEQEIVSPVMNPQASEALDKFKKAVESIQKSMTVVKRLISEELTKEKELN